MSDEQQDDPMWKQGDLNFGKTIKITLESAKEVASGESKFGKWNLWIISVENAKVRDKQTKKLIEGHTGKATCFPSEKLHESFLDATNGTKEGVKVEIISVPKKNKEGKPYIEYEVTIVEEGETPPDNISHTDNKFIKDFKTFVDANIVSGTKEDFMGFAKSDTYKLDEETAEKLWVVYEEEK